MAVGAVRLSLTFTPYTPEHAAEVRELADLLARSDGIEAFGEQTLFNLTSDTATHFLVHDHRPAASDPRGSQDTPVLAYAQVDHDSAELAVHPAHRRRGIGGELTDAVKAHAPAAAIWAHGNLESAQNLARSRGLAPVRELVYMTAELDPAGELPPVPGGIEVKEFTASDAADWLAVNAQAFADHPEQGRLTQADLDERTAQPWFDPTVFWLARNTDAARGDVGDLLGYMWVKREAGADTAEIYVLGVSPAAQGRGLGKFLTDYALAQMAARGAAVMDLYVEGDNGPALATYTRYGFSRAITHVQYR